MNTDTLKTVKKMKVEFSVVDELGQIWKQDHNPVILAMTAYNYGRMTAKREERARRKTRDEQIG